MNSQLKHEHEELLDIAHPTGLDMLMVVLAEFDLVVVVKVALCQRTAEKIVESKRVEEYEIIRVRSMAS